MEVIIIGLVLIPPILLANVLVKRKNKKELLIFDIVLLLINGLVLVSGLIMAVVPADLLEQTGTGLPFNVDSIHSAGSVLSLIALWGVLVALTPVRRLFARIMPLDPDSPVHTLALVLAGYLVGQGALALSQGGLEGLEEIAEPTSLVVVVAVELLFAILALFGIGFLVRRQGRQLVQRLGLERPTQIQLVVAAGAISFLVVLQFFAGLLYAYLYPEQAQVIENLSDLLLADMNTLGEWLVLALAAGIGEEILFRGALQPVFGLGFTSILFAVIHAQYGFTPVTLVMVILALIIGLIRRYYNTTVAIIVHVGYDFVLGLLVLLVPYLEQFAPPGA